MMIRENTVQLVTTVLNLAFLLMTFHLFSAPVYMYIFNRSVNFGLVKIIK
jgi:hypothetical protein